MLVAAEKDLVRAAADIHRLTDAQAEVQRQRHDVDLIPDVYDFRCDVAVTKEVLHHRTTHLGEDKLVSATESSSHQTWCVEALG